MKHIVQLLSLLPSSVLLLAACRGPHSETHGNGVRCENRLGYCDGDILVLCSADGPSVVDCPARCTEQDAYIDGICLTTYARGAMCACTEGVACEDRDLQGCSGDELAQCKLEEVVYTNCTEVCTASGFLHNSGCVTDDIVGGLCNCEGYGRIPCSTDADCDSKCCAVDDDGRVCQRPDVCGHACAADDDECSRNDECCGYFANEALCTLFSPAPDSGRCAPVCADDDDCDDGCCLPTKSGKLVCHPSSFCGMSTTPSDVPAHVR